MGFVEQMAAAQHAGFRQRVVALMIKTAQQVQGEHRIAAADQKTITSITGNNPAQVSSTAHGFSLGDEVLLMDVVGMRALDVKSTPAINGGRYVIGPGVSADAYDLRDVDGTAYRAYGSGGVAGSTFLTAAQQAKRGTHASELLNAFAFVGGTLTVLGVPGWLDTWALAIAVFEIGGTPIGDADQTGVPTPEADLETAAAGAFDDVAGVTGEDLV